MDDGADSLGGAAPGKRARTDGLAVRRRASTDPSAATASTAAASTEVVDDPFALHLPTLSSLPTLPIMRKAAPAAGAAQRQAGDRGDIATAAIAGKGSGASLPGPVQQHFGAAYGTDLSSVRVHTDASASQAVDASGARAFAYGSDVFFGSGQYDPGSSSGQFLIGHELAHVAQQGSQPAPQAKRVGATDDPAEHQADAAAHAALETGQTGDVHEVEASAAATAALAGQRAPLSSAAPKVRFFAQDEGPTAGGGGHARLTETALHGMGGLSDAEVRTARMGNWERDLSQVLTPTTASLGLTAPDRPVMKILNLIALNDFGRGINLSSFGTYDPVEHIDNPTGLRGTDVIDQGGAAGTPARHPDGANPDTAASISGAHPAVGAAGTGHQAYADLDDRYRHNSHTAEGGHDAVNGHDATAFQVDETAIPNYIYGSRDWCTQTLRNAARLGTQRNLHNADGSPAEETLHGPRMFSSGVHTLQDYFAHSNFCEIALNILVRAGGLRVATATTESRDAANHRTVTAATTADLSSVAGVGGRVLDSHVHGNDAHGNPTAPNLTVGDREVITTGSFNLTDTIDSLAEELSAKWRALDPFRVKPDEPSPLMLAAMDYIEMDPANPANINGCGQAMADFIHPAVATISALGSGGAAVVDGAGTVAAGGAHGLAALGSGALDTLGAGADLLHRHTGVGGDAAASLHGGARAVTAGGDAVASGATGATGAAADGIRGLVTQLQAQEQQLRTRQHTLRELYQWAYGHGPLDLLKAAARNIPVVGPAAAAAIEMAQQQIHALIEGLLGTLWNAALDAGTAVLNEFIGAIRNQTNVSGNRRPVAAGPFRETRQHVADTFGNVSEFFDDNGRPRPGTGAPGGGEAGHYSGIAPASYTPPSHSEIAKDHGDIENRPGEAHAHAGGGHVEEGNWLNGLAMALAQLATTGVGVPVNACWAQVDEGHPVAATAPALDAIDRAVNLYFDHPAANQSFWESTVRGFVGGELGPALIEHLRGAHGSAPDAPGPLVDVPVVAPTPRAP
ncbi:MAG: DUF4157 domain-containing protein [Myxococcales bacterium]|nr:DUF4157 domain-containing protein [Myxococcales bacterium]